MPAAARYSDCRAGLSSPLATERQAEFGRLAGLSAAALLGACPSWRRPSRRRDRPRSPRPSRRPSRPPRARPSTTPATVKLSLAVNSPLPSRRTPSLPPRARPAALSAAWSIVALASSLPASITFWIAPEVHLGIVLGEDVVEAALRDPHVERHLAAFEAVDRDARAALRRPSGRGRRSCPCPSRCHGRRACGPCGRPYCRGDR